MSSPAFIEQNLYYQYEQVFWEGSFQPIISTWVYLGKQVLANEPRPKVLLDTSLHFGTMSSKNTDGMQRRSLRRSGRPKWQRNACFHGTTLRHLSLHSPVSHAHHVVRMGLLEQMIWFRSQKGPQHRLIVEMVELVVPAIDRRLSKRAFITTLDCYRWSRG